MPAGHQHGPHRHGYRVNSECADPLCQSYWRGYQTGLRARNTAKRNAAAIEVVKLLRPDEEDGPVTVRQGLRP